MKKIDLDMGVGNISKKREGRSLGKEEVKKIEGKAVALEEAMGKIIVTVFVEKNVKSLVKFL